MHPAPRMFLATPAPVVGGLVRSGLGTSLCWVHYVMPHPLTTGAWLVATLPCGTCRRGVWQAPGNTHAGSNGARAHKWRAVYPARWRAGWHPVQPGPGMPPMPVGCTQYAPA